MASPTDNLSHPDRFALSLIGLFAWLGPLLYEQSTMLVNKLPDYLRKLGAAYGIASGDLTSQMEESIHRFQIDPRQVLGQLFQTTGRAVGILTFILTRATYLALSITLVGLYVFFFSWHFNAGLAKLSAHVPETRKQRVFAILARMDDAIGDFFRGRLVIAIITGVLLSVGWFLVGVPYWFFLGMVTGFLIIVPYLSIIIWPVAIILKYVDTLTGGMAESGGIMTVVVWPSVVFGVVQFLGGLGSNTVDPERSDQSERRYNYSRRFHRRVGGRRIGNAAGHPGGCMHQDVFRRGRAAALKEMGCDPLKSDCTDGTNIVGRMGAFSAAWSKHFLQSLTGCKISAHSMHTASGWGGRRANIKPFH